MTREEILNCYSKVKGCNPDQIREIVEKELRPNAIGVEIGKLFGVGCCAGVIAGHSFNKEVQQQELENICKKTIQKNSSTIKEILKKHPNYTNYVIDIIMLLAPAIAQQYLGISAMAIVGSITIICKQGIHAYLH